MADYDLYYWPVPFRGQFIRAILAYAGEVWDEHGPEAITLIMQARPREQPVPFMGPPMLVERKTGFALSQMPAIAMYLGERLDLLPSSIELRALTNKVVNDANDVIDEITLDGGREMWTDKTWLDFQPRLARWMEFWEALGSACGLGDDAGYLLGTDKAGVADIVTATLWSTMSERLPSTSRLLEKTAPRTAALSRRMQDHPALAELSRKARETFGDSYCGGEIEKSLRAVAQ